MSVFDGILLHNFIIIKMLPISLFTIFLHLSVIVDVLGISFAEISFSFVSRLAIVAVVVLVNIHIILPQRGKCPLLGLGFHVAAILSILDGFEGSGGPIEILIVSVRSLIFLHNLGYSFLSVGGGGREVVGGFGSSTRKAVVPVHSLLLKL